MNLLYQSIIFIVLSLIISSCSTGPSKEDLARWKGERIQAKQERIKNTDMIVDHFINELWNKPISKIMTSSKKHSIRNGNRNIKIQAIGKVNLHNSHLIKKKFTAECNPELNSKKNNPVLTAVIREDEQPANFRKDQMFHIGMGFDFAWDDNIYDAKLDCKRYSNGKGSQHIVYGRDLRYFQPLMNGYYMNTLGVDEIRKKLIKKGVPLLYCHKRFEYNENRLYCAIDWYFVKTYAARPAASFYIVTDGDKLKEFVIRELSIGSDEEHLSLSQIYHSRINDKITKYKSGDVYEDNIAAFNEWMIEIIENDKQYRIDKEQESAARGAAYQQAVMARMDALDGDDPTYVTRNPYKQDKMLTEYNKTMDKINAATNSTRKVKNSGTENGSNAYSSASTKRVNSNHTQASSAVKPKSTHPQDAEKKNCINAGKKWMGSSCDYSSSVSIQGWTRGNTATVDSSNTSSKPQHSSSYNPTSSGAGNNSTSSTKNDNCCYDIGLSDKTYGDALDKAKKKAESVCRRKGGNLVPVDLFHEKVDSSGWKYKSHLNYKCGSKTD